MKIPIDFINHKYEITNNLKDDIHIDELYNKIFEPKTKCSSHFIPKLTNYYTNNKSFLKDSQLCLKELSKVSQTYEQTIIDKWNEEWNDIKQLELVDFEQKYQYLHWDYINYLNQSKPFVNVYSYYLILSPLSTISIPLLFFIIPFIIIKIISKEKLTWDGYKSILTAQLIRHIFGSKSNIAYEWMKGSRDWNTITYIIFTSGLYLYNIYKSIMNVIDYYKQTKMITSFFTQLKTITSQSLLSLEQVINTIKHPITKAWKKYKSYLKQKYKLWTEFYNKYLEHHNDFSIHTISSLGTLMYDFYSITYHDSNHLIIEDMYEWNGYYELLCSLSRCLGEKKNIINYCSFKGPYNKFKNLYYPLINNSIKNNVKFNKRGQIITGVNASGKTTLLKSILFSSLLTQQFGVGCYDKGTRLPHLYTHFFSYINIPDTNDRNSLFQSEAKRCKTILEHINTNEHTLCIFDELYSGTNPLEATSASISFIYYLLSNYPKLHLCLTTHYHDVCKLLKTYDFINLLYMKSIVEENNIKMTYKLEQGICKTHGGIFVLKEFKYPLSMIEHAENVLRLFIKQNKIRINQ